jgi:FkbM family methyltransferase
VRISNRITRMLFSFLPRNDSTVYQYCRHYVNVYNNENNGDIHSNGELKLMQNYLPQSKVVLDVGANVGEWSKLALEINRNIELHCFEPSHYTYQKLFENHFPPNVICNNFGLSSVCQQANLLIFEEGSGLNSLYRRDGLEDGYQLAAQTKSEVIELRTLDDYVEESGIDTIDFLKVDIEGHELDFFRGSRKMISQYRIKVLQFEYGGCNIDARTLLKDYFSMFADYPRYRFYKIFPDAIHEVKRYDQRLENFQYQNWVILLSE